MTTIPGGYVQLNDWAAANNYEKPVWDRATGTVKMGSTTYQPGQYRSFGQRAYVPAASLLTNYTKTPRVGSYDPQNFQKYSNIARQWIDPEYSIKRNKLADSLNKLNESYDTNVNRTNIDYANSESNLNRSRQADWVSASKAAGNNPIAAARRSQVTAGYAPQYEQLDESRTRALQDLARSKADNIAELQANATELEKWREGQIAQQAYNMMNNELTYDRGLAESDRANTVEMLKYLASRGDQEQERQDNLDQYDWDFFQRKNGQDSWAKQMDLLSLAAKENSGSGGSSSIPQWQVKDAQQQQAESWVQQNIGKYKRPIDFKAQVTRDFESGNLPGYINDYVQKYLTNTYGTEGEAQKTLPSWANVEQERKNIGANFIVQNRGKFKSPKDMYAEINRQIQSRDISPIRGQAILSILASKYMPKGYWANSW